MRVKLGDISVLLNGDRGKNYPSQADITELGEIPFVNAGHLTGRDISFDDMNYISREKYEQLNAGKFCKGDILYCLRGSLGKKALVKDDIKGAIASSLVIIRADESIVDKDYLMFALDSPTIREQLLKANNGSSQPNLSAASVREYEFDLPDITAQVEVVNKLIKVRNIIDGRKQELEKLDNLIKSRFVEMFGDPNVEIRFETHKFKEYAIDMTKGPFGSDMKKELFVPKGKDTYKVYIQANAIQGNQNLGEYYISKEYFDRKISRFEVQPGDYIITCDGTLGKHLKLNDEMEKGVISPSLLRLTLREDKITKEYFEYIWDMYMLPLMKKEARNACLVHLPSSKVIGEVNIPVPPYEIQKEFSKVVKQVHKLKFFTINYTKLLHKGVNSFGN